LPIAVELSKIDAMRECVVEGDIWLPEVHHASVLRVERLNPGVAVARSGFALSSAEEPNRLMQELLAE
jgi:hypothetical protein